MTPFRARCTLALLSVAYGVNALDRVLLGLLMEPIKTEFAASDAEMGFLTGPVFAIFYVLVGIPLARLADRSNRKALVVGSLIVFSVATLASGLTSTFTSLLFARIFVAIGESGQTPASTSILADCYRSEKRQLPMVIFTTGGFLGGALGIFVIGCFGLASEWRHVFVISSAPGFLLAFLLLVMVREPRRPFARTAATSISVHLDDLLPLKQIVELLKVPSFRRMALGFSTAMLVAYASLSWMPSFLSRNLGFDANQVFLFGAIAWGLGGAAGALASGAIAAKLRLSGADRPLLLCSTMSFIFTTAFCFSFLFRDSVLTLPALALGLFLVGGSQGPVFALAQDLVRNDRRAVATALLLFLASIVGLGVGPLAVGLLSDAFHPVYGSDSVRYSLTVVIAIGGFLSGKSFLTAAESIESDIMKYGENPAIASD